MIVKRDEEEVKLRTAGSFGREPLRKLLSHSSFQGGRERRPASARRLGEGSSAEGRGISWGRGEAQGGRGEGPVEGEIRVLCNERPLPPPPTLPPCPLGGEEGPFDAAGCRPLLPHRLQRERGE